MSKGIKTVASIALPIVGSIVGGPIGGAIGGAIGGGLNGGLPGAIMGAVGGYAGAGAVNSVVGTAAGTPLATVTGNAALYGPTQGSGILGAVTGGGVRALGAGLTQAATTSATDPLRLIAGIGDRLMTQSAADATAKAAKQQTSAIDAAIATQQPYNQYGQEAMARIKTIQDDPAGYIKNNPLYTSLAADAERRLLANQAAKGKVGSGGTAAALQDQLLQIGNGLVQQQVGQLQSQVNTGQGSAAITSGLNTDRGVAQSAGTVGVNNVQQAGYRNQIDTLLALQGVNRTPAYSPTASLWSN